MPVPALYMGKHLGEARLSAAFHFLPDMFTATWRVFLPRQWPPSYAGGLAFWHPACSPAEPLSTLTVALQVRVGPRHNVEPR